ncbi:GNAT family N-acetyltransferase [Chloroflexota bacterium]
MAVVTNILNGENVRLTAITDQDIATMTRWYEDAAYLRLFDARPAVPRSADMIRADIERLQKSANDFVFAIKPLADETCLGYLEIDGVLWAHGVAGMGIGIGATEQRGQGFGTEAGALGLRFAFAELNLHRITATVFDYNAASLRMCEKLGFQREGVFREFLCRDGQRHDMILLGLLRHEWSERQNA